MRAFWATDGWVVFDVARCRTVWRGVGRTQRVNATKKVGWAPDIDALSSVPREPLACALCLFTTCWHLTSSGGASHHTYLRLCESNLQQSAVPRLSKEKVVKIGADQNAAIRFAENFLCVQRFSTSSRITSCSTDRKDKEVTTEQVHSTHRNPGKGGPIKSGSQCGHE